MIKEMIAREMGQPNRRVAIAWMRRGPALLPNFCVLLQPRPPESADLVELGTGAYNLVGVDPAEPLEPVE